MKYSISIKEVVKPLNIFGENDYLRFSFFIFKLMYFL